jgi:hypothetical protein
MMTDVYTRIVKGVKRLSDGVRKKASFLVGTRLASFQPTGARGSVQMDHRVYSFLSVALIIIIITDI